jgi:hypothetical protein
MHIVCTARNNPLYRRGGAQHFGVDAKRVGSTTGFRVDVKFTSPRWLGLWQYHDWEVGYLEELRSKLADIGLVLFETGKRILWEADFCRVTFWC